MTTKKENPMLHGFEQGQKILDNWRQKNGGEVYVFGRRVHHGPIFGLLTLAGIYTKDPSLIGFGLSGVIDDIDDVNDWLRFEKGRNPDSIFDVVKSQNYL